MHDERRPPPTRRDFVCVSAGAFASAGGATAAWPLVSQLSPNPGAPRHSSLVDLAPIRPGQGVAVAWQGQPVFIRHRTGDEIARARGIPLDGLPDPYARNAMLPASAPATDANRTLAGHPQWLVVVGLCTHLGCRLRTGDSAEGDGSDEAWVCPCHAARFDLSGRVRSGPARTNLPVPPWRFVTASRIEIGRT